MDVRVEKVKQPNNQLFYSPSCYCSKRLHQQSIRNGSKYQIWCMLVQEGVVKVTLSIPSITREPWLGPETKHGEIALDLFGGPVLRQRRDKETIREDKRTGRQTGGGEGWGKRELRGGDVSSRRFHPFTLLSYKGDTIRVGPKERGPCFFFPPFSFIPLWADVLSPRPKWAARGEVWRMGGWQVGKDISGRRPSFKVSLRSECVHEDHLRRQRQICFDLGNLEVRVRTWTLRLP